jgi:hypothetical protein
MTLEPRLNATQNDAPSTAVGEAELSSSREDERSICSLAEELSEPRELMADIDRRDLARLRQSARVTAFPPLVVSRQVARRGAKRSDVARRS